MPMWMTALESDAVQTSYKVLLLEMAVVISINVVMNFYWASLIVKQVGRVLKRGFATDGLMGGQEEVSPEKEKKLVQSKEAELGPILNANAIKSDLDL